MTHQNAYKWLIHLNRRYQALKELNAKHRPDTLPEHQLYKMGLIYGIYRIVISLFLFLSSRTIDYQDNIISVVLPSFYQQVILIFYGMFSFLMLALFYVVKSNRRSQLGLGLAFDVIILSLLLYLAGTPDVQIVMLYVVVIAASFIMLAPYQAIIITLLAIIFIIYQQFFYAITDALNIANLGDAVLLSISFLGVGFISWHVSQQLATVEAIAKEQAFEVEKLHFINQQVIASMSQGVMVIDGQAQVKLVNDAALKLLNIVYPPLSTPDALMVNPLDEPINTTFGEAQETILATRKEFATKEQQIKSSLASQHPALFEWLTTHHQQYVANFHYQLVLADESVVNLRVQSSHLADGSRLIMLEDMRREQTNAQQLKLASLGQLTASIAHEIRNPLAAISQASQLLIEDAKYQKEHADDTQSNAMDDNAELYAMIFAQTKRVNRIIEDVLNLSRQAKPKLSQIHLTQWLSQFLQEHFAEHDVFLHAHCTPRIQFDPHQLEQILINLIHNGLRYSSQSHPHAFVEVEISCQANDVIIDVLDDGIGVAKEHQSSLFNPFFTTDTSGTGLGLYLSQAFSEANDARLVYVPSHQKTCFRLIIPALIDGLIDELPS